MRVGAWRFFELFARLGIRPTLAINARVCEDYPRVAEQAKRDGWEFMGHSYEQGPIHKEPDQAAMIERSLVDPRALHRHAPGRLARARTDADLETPELLAAAGIKYIGDWVYDDEPTTIRTAKGPLVTLPYSVELNDIPMMIVQHHESDYLLEARDRPVRPALRRGRASARRSWRSRSTPTSAASRTASNTSKRSTTTSRRFDGVLHWNGVEILDWYLVGDADASGVGSSRCQAVCDAPTPERRGAPDVALSPGGARL